MSFGRIKYIPWLASRFVLSKSRFGLSFMTWISILGVAVGIGALIIVMSVMAGFSDDLKKNLLENTPHITVYNNNKSSGFSLNKFPLAMFYKSYSKAKSVVPFVKSEIVLQRGKVTTSASILGVRQSDGEVMPWPLKRGLFSGTFDLKPSEDDGRVVQSIFLADKVARALGAKIGDSVKVLNPFFRSDDLFLGQPLIFKFVVSGVFFPLAGSGGEEQSRFAVVSLPNARMFLPEYDTSLDQDNFVSGVAVTFADPWEVEQYTDVSFSSSGLQAISWQQSNSSLLFALQLEKYAMAFVLMLIVLVAAFSICGTLIMNSFHRRTQVSILRALGMTRKQVFELFLSHGALIGLAGVVLGVTVSVCICYLISSNSAGEMVTGLDLSRLPVKFLPFDYLVICSSAWILTVLSSVMPSMMAARQPPTQGLRGF